MDSDSDKRWGALGLAGLGIVLSLTTWFSATAILPDLVALLGLRPEQGAWLTNAVQLGFVTGALASSFLSLADIVALPRLLAVSALLAAAANMAVWFEPGLGGMLGARFLTGMALAGVYPPSLKFIATWFKSGRGLAMGSMVGALTLGSAAPHLVRALGAAFDWHAVVLTTSLASLAAALIFGLVLREGPHGFARSKVDPRQIGAILRDRPVMLANAGYFGHMWELYAMWGWFLAYAREAIDGSGWGMNASILAFGVIAMGAPGCVLAGYLADRIGRCATTSLAMALSGSSALIIGFVFDGPAWLFVPVALIWGLTVVADSAQFSAAVTELSDPKRVGASLAFQMGVGFGLTIFTIWLMPIIADLLGGWQWTFLVLVPGPVLGTLAMLRLRGLPEAARLAGGRR